MGRTGYICNSSRILIFEKASPRSKVVGSLAPGTQFQVIGGPECGERRVWWKVRLYIANEGYTGMIGWMPESDRGRNERYLCPTTP